jgi:type VII secretion integral membrane protein EccD
MTLVENSSSTTTERSGVSPAERVRLIEQVRVAVIFEGRQTDLTLPANSSVASVVDSALRVLLEPGETVRPPDKNGMVRPGTLALSWINGAPLDRGQTLAQQSVVDGDVLILEVTDTDVTFTPVVENASSAIAKLLSDKGSTVQAETAVLFATIAAAAGVVVALALLLNAWRLNLGSGQDWNLWPAAAAGGLSVALLATGAIVWWRRRAQVVAQGLWLSALLAAPAAAVMAVPGHPTAWHAVFGFATAAVGAAVLWRLTPGADGVLAWVTITATAFLVLTVIHAAGGVSMTHLWVGALAVALLVLCKSEGLAGRIARIPMPPFPTVTGKFVFDDADEIAAEAVAAAEHDGTPSVAELGRGAVTANTYLTALVAATSVFFVLGGVGAVIPGHGRWWLATVYVLILGTILVLQGRAYADRVQAIIVVATGLVMTTALAVKYALSSHDPPMSFIIAGAVLVLGAAGLIVAATVPTRVFSPLFRKVVEWLDYALKVLVPPLALWLLNLYYLARNH